jgi:hypothetical protein
VVVDKDGGADVHGGYQDDTLADTADLDLLRDLVGDVDDLLAALGLEPEIVSVSGHLRVKA